MAIKHFRSVIVLALESFVNAGRRGYDEGAKYPSKSPGHRAGLFVFRTALYKRSHNQTIRFS
jgi:hypothetical protein